ncbi:MAG TPA: hypothetical protein VME41_09635, partial [Stellaceae bacterium]|nr:hypothetical protein [Stellaceae bacterium]
YCCCLVAAGLVVVAASARAQPQVNESAQQNVRESRQYEQLLCTNPAFRAKRIAQECGPLQGSQFYSGCVASFNCSEQPNGANWRQEPPSERISR